MLEPSIKPTNFIDLEKEEAYTLEDKDFLLIQAIRNLSQTIEKLRLSLIK